MPSEPTTVNAGFWAITSFFNPAGFRSRLENFRVFRSHLNLPLAVVELGYGRDFELRGGDAEILIQLRGGDVMWQKERLLNLALQALPVSCDKVAWIDCDVVFASPAWADQASRALDHHRLLHPFSKRVNLDAGASPDAPTWDPNEESVSTVREWAAGDPVDWIIALGSAQFTVRQTMGLAWAAQRSILDERGFYDRAILGHGDRLMAAAALGCFEAAEQVILMNPAQRKDYRAWAEPFHENVGERVGCLDQKLYHLWHGDLRDRRYRERHEGLRRFDFDPEKDLALSESGCWRWASHKPEMHRYVNDYFASRREDA